MKTWPNVFSVCNPFCAWHSLVEISCKPEIQMCHQCSPTCVFFGSPWTFWIWKVKKEKIGTQRNVGCFSYISNGHSNWRKKRWNVPDFVYRCMGISCDVYLLWSTQKKQKIETPILKWMRNKKRNSKNYKKKKQKKTGRRESDCGLQNGKRKGTKS